MKFLTGTRTDGAYILYFESKMNHLLINCSEIWSNLKDHEMCVCEYRVLRNVLPTKRDCSCRY